MEKYDPKISIAEVARMFKKMDKDGNGNITLEGKKFKMLSYRNLKLLIIIFYLRIYLRHNEWLDSFIKIVSYMFHGVFKIIWLSNDL